MAIKFSELRGLLKDTNIQTVKMSDPVYSIQMEKITYKNYYNFSEQRKSISFNNLHYLKNNNQLYLLNQILPFNIRIDFIFGEKVLRNTRLVVNKNPIFKLYQLATKNIDRLYHDKQIPNTLYSCFYLNNINNDNILNPCLTRVILSDYVNDIKYYPKIEVNKYYNSSWHILNDIKKVQRDDTQLVFYDYEIIDRDVRLNSSVLFYTSPITNDKYTNISVFLGYKPNDNIKERYKGLQISSYHMLYGTKNDIFNSTFSFGESYFSEKSENLSLSVYDTGMKFLEDLR